MTRAKSAQMHAAKARKRMAAPPPDYPAMLDYESPVESWTFKDYRRGKIRKLVLYHSRRRRGCFRVLVNGREWNKCIGYDRLMRKTVTSLAQ